MNYKVRNLLIALIVLTVAVGGIILYFTGREKPPIEIITQPEVTERPAEQPVINRQQVQDNLIKRVEGKTVAEVDDFALIMSTSRFFIERYGSFSSSANWQNLLDLRVAVTDNMYQDFRDLIDDQVSVVSDDYFSLTTKVVALTVLTQDDTEAQVEAETQKREVRGSDQEIYYQTITVDLTKQGGTWLVGAVEEGPKRK